MNVKRLFLVLFFILSFNSAANAELNWNDWHANLFSQAKKENKFILLDLEAVWCHWCHVMEETTYQDEKVIALIRKHYIPIRVDQDARPDLANRYRDYGWPATIIFAPDGTEIVKRAGYIAPENMRRLLQAIVDDPSPEKIAQYSANETQPAQTSLTTTLRTKLIERHTQTYDKDLGGLLNAQKYLDRDSVEYAMLRATQGDQQEANRAQQTFDAALALFDPAWGGVYQYSTHGDWQHPHFEKIMSVQASYLRIYALAYAQFKKPRYKKAIEDIYRYTRTFLTAPNGAFYTSQDADLIPGEHSDEFFSLTDTQRRAQGIPRIDMHQYARENGWMIEALVTSYEVTGEQHYLQAALDAANWVHRNRRNLNDSYRHDSVDQAGPYLGDNLAMARASLNLYRATGDRKWLTRSEKAARTIEKLFKHPRAGYYSAVADPQSPIKPVVQIDENMSVARYFNLLAQTTGITTYRDSALHTVKFLATKEIALSRLTEAGILLVDHEINQDPLHITIIGFKNEATAQNLYRRALQQSGWYKRIEWWDTREGKLRNPDVKYPVLDRSAAFVCTDSRCSLPLFNVTDLEKLLSRREPG